MRKEQSVIKKNFTYFIFTLLPRYTGKGGAGRETEDQPQNEGKHLQIMYQIKDLYAECNEHSKLSNKESNNQYRKVQKTTRDFKGDVRDCK